MNPLTHCKFSLEWLENNGFRIDNDLVVLGSILPDLSYMGFIPELEAHTKSVEFLKYLQKNDPSYVALGIGFMLHGEKPYCLDYFTHKSDGYIEKKSVIIAELLEHAKFNASKWYLKNKDDFIHSLIEFSGDTLMEPDVAKKIHRALSSVNLFKVSFHLASFFKSDPNVILRSLQFFKTFNFQRLQSTKGVVHAIQDFFILRAFSHKNNTMEKYGAIMNRLNPWRTHKLIKILNSTREIVGEDYKEFLAITQEKIKKNTSKHAAQVLL